MRVTALIWHIPSIMILINIAVIINTIFLFFFITEIIKSKLINDGKLIVFSNIK
jgi:hypothetical protein